MSQFVENAARIFETAERAASDGHSLSSTTILISPTGGIQILADNDWPLESLQAYHGAQMAYRVSQQETAVRVQGRAGGKTCLFEADRPEKVARRLLGYDQRQYRLTA